MPTTASQAPFFSQTATDHTLLQVQISNTLGAHIVDWGFTTDYTFGYAMVWELVETDVAATVTAHVASGIVRVDEAAVHGGDPTTNLIQVGTAATGYNATAEGTITATRVLDTRMTNIQSNFVLPFPRGEQPYMKPGLFYRVRMRGSINGINLICFMTIEV